MKKPSLMTILLALLLSACSSVSSGPQAGFKLSSESLPKATQLLVGTMKLDGTEQDVTAQQAGELLPMWQVYGELITSDNAAQAEIDALIVQIEENMTDEQMKAIAEMNFTQQDVAALIQQQNLGTEQTHQTSSSSSKSGGSSFAPPDAGAMPMGGPPDAGGMSGGMPLPDQTTNGSNSTTPGSSQSQVRSVDGVPSALIQVLVELLKSKAEF